MTLFATGAVLVLILFSITLTALCAVLNVIVSGRTVTRTIKWDYPVRGLR